MPRQKAFIVAIGICVLLLGACSSFARVPVSAPTSTPAPASPYDGQWTGKGTSPDGRSIYVVFTVRAGVISSFSYTYSGLDGTSCTGIDHQQIPPGQQPGISNAHFADQFGDDLTASGSFSSPGAASGHIFAQWKGRLNCSATIEADWTAAKSPPPAQTTVIVPVSTAWCGKNVNCRELPGPTADLRPGERFHPGT